MGNRIRNYKFLGYWLLAIGYWLLARLRLMAIPVVCYLLSACNSTSNQKEADELRKIAADESLKPVLTQLYDVYKATHDNIDLKLSYLPERSAIDLLLKHKASVAFTTRELNENEKKAFKADGTSYRPQVIATDAVALITAKNNNDSLVRMEDLEAIFTKKITNWEQLPQAKRKGKIVLVFDDANASNINYMMQKMSIKTIEGLNIFAAGSNLKVIDYVKTNANAIGFIGVSWISDGDQPLTKELSTQLNVMSVAAKDSVKHYQPFQDNLKYHRYPLLRGVFAISRSTNSTSPTSNFVNYMLRDVGTIVIEKCGLWPKRPYRRVIEVKKEL